MLWPLNKFRALLSDETGVTSMEYGLIVAIIGITLIISLDFVGEETDSMFGGVASELSNTAS